MDFDRSSPLSGSAACAAPEPRQVANPSNGTGAITRSQVVTDIDYALTALADMHPILYWRSDPRDILRLKQELRVAGSRRRLPRWRSMWPSCV